MVVAMLSALFIVGAAFLSAVTFESSSIARVQSIQQRSSVIDGLSREVRDALRRGFLGSDGKAWNREFVVDTNADMIPDAPSRIGNDTYGEVAGFHPLIASIEPYTPDDPLGPDPKYYWYQASDLELVLSGRPRTGALDKSGTVAAARNLVHVNLPIGVDNPNPDFAVGPMFDSANDGWSEQLEGQTVLVVPTPAGANDPPMQLYRRDADGDGVWDSYEYALPMDRFPPSKRGDLPQQLRQPDFDNTTVGLTPEQFAADPNFAADTLFYALRVIPHGAMLDVGHAHRTMLEEVLDSTDAKDVGGPYVSEGEELWLRRRFLLPSREPVLSALQLPTAAGQIASKLYDAFPANNALNLRWWPIDTGLDGNLVNQIEDGDPDDGSIDWLDWVDYERTGVNGYAFRQILTTISHDDQLMPVGRDNAGSDWIDTILANEATLPPPDDFSIDEWPDATNSALAGRLKVSLPGLVQKVLIDSKDPLFASGGAYEFLPIDALADAALPSAIRDRFIRTIQDGFMLMLRNVVDHDDDGTPWATDTDDRSFIEETAAALTANLIDFVDSDGDPNSPGIPTQVEIRKVDDGTGTGQFVYGLEAQPFITELYHYNDGSTEVSAIELFNPYSQPIDLSVYKLVDTDATAPKLDHPLTGVLANDELPAKSYAVFASGDSGAGAPTGAMLLGAAAGEWRLKDASQVELLRTGFVEDTTSVDVIVDRFSGSSAEYFGTAPDTTSPPDSEPFTFVSLERVTGNTSPATEKEWTWKWVVPIFVEQINAHTLGSQNNANAPVTISPVEVCFANSGEMQSALPTTGSLLLLLRYANSKNAPFNDTLDDLGRPERVDNGHLPIFRKDPTTDSTDIAESAAAGVFLPKEIPWGQLVFDYFTALPLEHAYTPQFDLSVQDDCTPTIDQNGLRVHGRVDLNSAPWKVLAGVPIVPREAFAWPPTLLDKIGDYALNPGQRAIPLGERRAKSIVAYREARLITDGVNSTEDFAWNLTGSRYRQGTGFLTVGELANVRASGPTTAAPGSYNLDSDVANDPTNADFVEAAALLITLGDWVTTRSHVFTIYGTLRGVGQKSAVDQRAIRFQETVDRLPSFYNNLLPRRVGPRVVGPYAQANEN